MSKLIPESVIDDLVRTHRPTQMETTILHLLWDAEPHPISGKSLAESLKVTRNGARGHIWNLRRRMTGCKTLEVCGRQGTGYWLEYRK